MFVFNGLANATSVRTGTEIRPTSESGAIWIPIPHLLLTSTLASAYQIRSCHVFALLDCTGAMASDIRGLLGKLAGVDLGQGTSARETTRDVQYVT